MKEPDYTTADYKTIPAYWSVYTIFSPTMGFFCERDSQTGSTLWCISFDGAKKFDAFKDGVDARGKALAFAEYYAKDAEVRCYRRCDVYPEEYNRVEKAAKESEAKHEER